MRSYLKIALIPAYNPEPCLLDLIQKLKEKDFWILVVDDGSTQEHKKIFQDMDERVLVLTHNQNKRERKGFKNRFDFIFKTYNQGIIL